MRGGCCLCVCGFCGFPVPVCWTGPSRMHVYSCVSVCVCVLVAAAERGSVKLFVQYESYSHCACVCASCLSVGVCLCDYLCSSACKNLFEATTSSSSLTFDCMFLCVCVCVGGFSPPVSLPALICVVPDCVPITNYSLSEKPSPQLLRLSPRPPSSTRLPFRTHQLLWRQ